MSSKAEKGGSAKKGGSKKMVPILVGVVLLVVGLVVGKTVFGHTGHKKDGEKAKLELGATIPLDEFLVNLSGGDHYLKATIAVGMKKGITEEEAKDHIAPMRDSIITVLGSKSLKDLSVAANREALKEEVRTKVNDALGEEDIVKVYFTAFATQ